MYDPQESALDFEIGSLWDKAKKGLNKITDLTIVKPSEMIGGLVGQKKLGRKLGKFTAGVTKLGVGAGAAGVAAGLAPALAPVGVPVATALAAKHFASSKSKARKAIADVMHGRAKAKRPSGGGNVKTHARPKRHKSSKSSSDNAMAAKVAAMLVAKFGGPLGQIGKAIKLADLQRTATYEHKKLMSDADFRRAVLNGIANAAKNGNEDCQRTIRVLVGR